MKADTASIARAAALAFAALAIYLAAAGLHRDEPAAAVTVAPATTVDPVATELARCRAITDPAQVDDGCRRAWAERRARFFSVPDTRQ